MNTNSKTLKRRYQAWNRDVTLPLVPAVVEAMHKAVSRMGSADTFKGYGKSRDTVS